MSIIMYSNSQSNKTHNLYYLFNRTINHPTLCVIVVLLKSEGCAIHKDMVHVLCQFY